jgi:hypothetical protein
MNQFVTRGKKGTEGAVCFSLIVVFPEKCMSQGLIRFLALGFQAQHLFTLPANHRLMKVMIQMTEFYTDGGRFPLHLATVDQ